MEDGIRLDHCCGCGVAQRVLDELAAHVVCDRPAHDLLGVAVDHRGQIDEPGPGVNVGDVTDELDPGPIGREVAAHQVRHVSGCLAISSGRDPKRPWLTGNQTLGAHDLTDQLRRALGVLGDQIGVDPSIPIRLVGGGEERVDLHRQRLSTSRRC